MSRPESERKSAALPPDVWQAGWLARVAALVLAMSWVSVTIVIGTALMSGSKEAAWLWAMGLGVLGSTVLDALVNARSALFLDEWGVRLVFRRRHEVAWVAIGGIHFLERMSGSPMGAFTEEVEVRLLGRDGGELLEIPGTLGSRAQVRIAEAATARGFVKHEGEGGEASWVLLAPNAPAYLRSARAPGTRTRLVSAASRGFSGALLATIPLAVMAGHEMATDVGSMLPYWLFIGYGASLPFAALGIVGAFHKALGERGHQRLHLRLLGASVLGIVLGYAAGAWQLSAEADAVRAKADAIVRELEQYRASTGAYPDDLGALPGPVDVSFHCPEGTRTIAYRREETGYVLHFWLGRWDHHLYDSQKGKWVIRND